METLVLDRHPSEAYGTFGHLYRDDDEIAVTAEPPTPFIIGTYLCIRHNGPKFKNVWEVTDVPGHTAILLHNGNVPIPYQALDGTMHDETHDCVLVGGTFGRIEGFGGKYYDAIIDSKLTLAKLQRDLPDSFYLKVIQSTEPFEIGECSV